MDAVGGIPAGLAGALREAVVSLGADGNIEWANAAAGRLLRVDPADLVGTSGLDRVHPDEVARALDGIAFSTNHPERTAVVPFRIRRGDGTWADVELMSSVVAGDDGDHLVLVLRDAAPRRAVAEALASVATGAPLEETARWVARVIEARWPATVAGVLVDDRRERRLLGADRWDDDLRATLLTEPEAVSLWRAAAEQGGVAVFSGDDLPPRLQAVALSAGFVTCAVALVPDPGGATVALVAWFDLPDAGYMEFAHASVELCELLGLALERRHHVARLDYAVRHDPLTGLLNRTGFVEVVAAAEAATDQGAALLYLDLDGFKPVNDRHGHGVGDAVLRVVAGRLAAIAGDWAVARIGGDEFVLLGRGGADLEGRAGGLARAVVDAVGEPIEVPAGDGELVGVSIGASVGVAVADPGSSIDGLLELADGAMYAVKAGGGRGWSARIDG